MARAQDDIEDAALDWVIRTGNPDFAGWEAFTAWLEADPRHADRYHMLQADAATLAEMVPAAPSRAPDMRRRNRLATRRGWLAGAVAASLIGVVSYSTLQSRADPYVVETAAGVTRIVRLGDGSSIALNGGTRLTLDHHDDRVATVAQGEALFTVRHDPSRPFRVNVGGDELVDVGTVFDVIRSDGRTWVGVAEGAVIFNPREEAVQVAAGRALSIADGSDTVQVKDVAQASVGGWQQGRLDFAGAPLAEVAEALSRALGLPFTVDPAIAARPFSGTLAIAMLKNDPGRLAPLLDARVRRGAAGWEIAPAP